MITHSFIFAIAQQAKMIHDCDLIEKSDFMAIFMGATGCTIEIFAPIFIRLWFRLHTFASRVG